MKTVSTKDNTPLLSIVIPAYNEAESLPKLLQQLHAVIKTHAYRTEIIFVNDGSTDETRDVLEQLKSEQIIAIHFRQNRGKAAALMAGFEAAHGQIVITMDADLQDDPTEIPTLLEKLYDDNYDLVSGWKYPRKDPWEKRAFSFIFNRMTAWLTGVKLHDMNCGFKVYRAEVVKQLCIYGELHRYIPILAHQQGYRVGEIKVKHHPRQYGESKYGLKRIPKGFLDLITVLFITKYLKRPLHVFGTIGSLVTFMGVLIGGYLAVVWWMEGGIGFRPLLMLSVLMVILGMQFISIGLLGELIIRFMARLERKKQTEHEENTYQNEEAR